MGLGEDASQNVYHQCVIHWLNLSGKNLCYIFSFMWMCWKKWDVQLFIADPIKEAARLIISCAQNQVREGSWEGLFSAFAVNSHKLLRFFFLFFLFLSPSPPPFVTFSLCRARSPWIHSGLLAEDSCYLQSLGLLFSLMPLKTTQLGRKDKIHLCPPPCTAAVSGSSLVSMWNSPLWNLLQTRCGASGDRQRL